MFRARPGQDAPAGGEALGGHEVEEALLPEGAVLGALHLGDLAGHPAEHVQDAPLPFEEILPLGDGFGVWVKSSHVYLLPGEFSP